MRPHYRNTDLCKIFKIICPFTNSSLVSAGELGHWEPCDGASAEFMHVASPQLSLQHRDRLLHFDKHNEFIITTHKHRPSSSTLTLCPEATHAAAAATKCEDKEVFESLCCSSHIMCLIRYVLMHVCVGRGILLGMN